MKNICFLILVITLLITLTGCKKGESLINIKDGNSISIFYGFSSYAMFSEDNDTIKEVTKYLNALRFEETNKEMDRSSMLSIYISNNEEHNTKVCVDKNGVFWLDGKTDCYEIASGSFDYNYMKDIYEKY